MRKERYLEELSAASLQNSREGDYWRGKLAGDIVKTGFPYDSPDNIDKKNRAGTLKFTLPGELYVQLMRIGKGSHYTLHIILLAGIAALLYKYTGCRDIILGTSIYKQEVATRFINTVLPLRSRLDKDMTFKELILRMKTTIVEAVKNQNYPMEILVKQLGLTPGTNDTKEFPLFDVAVLLENIHERSYISHTRPNMIFAFRCCSSSIEAAVKYNAAKYDKTTVERINGHFTRLQNQLLANTDIPLSRADMMTQDEKNTLLYRFNDTVAEYPRDKMLHELFEEQVEKTPDGLALVGAHQLHEREKLQCPCSKKGQGPYDKLQTNSKSQITNYKTQTGYISYKELNRKAGQLAGILKDKGVQPDTIVGIMVNQSIETISGILGILKAGGAFMPIEPGYPRERIDYMLKDSGAGILLTSSDLSHCQLAMNPVGVHLHHSSFITHRSDCLAYVIYTSGSTGKPKGVMIQHSHIVNQIQGLKKIFFTCEPMNHILLAPFTFDPSVQHVFSPLTYGGKLFLPPDPVKIDTRELLEYIVCNRIDIFDAVPSQASALCEFAGKYKKLSFKIIILAGEVFTKKLFLELGEHFHIEKLINIYGPTEATINSTFYQCREQEHRTAIPIGKPLFNYKVLVLDHDLGLCPIGVTGEIYLAGEGIARGYGNRPELTRERYIPNPFHPAERIYKTGDRGKWLSDGNLEFAGRIDYQVKIRGRRVEPEEIERVLLSHDKINDAAIIARKNEKGEYYLCAYLVFAEDTATAAVKNYLAGKLADYMVPPYFIPLQKIPLTANGKPDRKALPLPGARDTGDPYTAPVTAVEKKLTAVWAGVLNLEPENIGIDSDFFRLGGHSLKAAALAAKIHEDMGIEIPLSEIFRTPTVRELARYMQNSRRTAYSAIAPVEKKEYYPLSPAQKRLYILWQMDENGTVYNMPLLLKPGMDIDIERFEQTFNRLIDRHESLRTFFALIAGTPAQGVRDEVKFKMEYYSAPEDTESFIRPFNLNQAPLFRAAVIKSGETTQELMLDMHHIISDGVSSEILMQDFITLYHGKDNGLSEPLRLQYKDYAEWQNSEKGRTSFKQQEAYWLESFTGEIPIIDLPADYKRPPVMTFQGDHSDFFIDREKTGALETLGLNNRASLFMVLAAAFYILLAKLNGSEDIVIGTPVAGRNHNEMQKIIGMFVNTLALRNYPAREKTVEQFLDEVKDNLLKAFDNQEYPFDQLVERLVSGRDTGRNPIFDVMFVLQNQAGSVGYPGQEKQEQSGELKSYEFENRISKFDLTLIAAEAGDGLFFTVEYRTHLFKKATIERFISGFKKITDFICTNPEGRISHISIVSEEEKQQVLYAFNDTAADYPGETVIHELFEEQAERTPHSVALADSALQLTYGELNRKSDQIARYLRDKGVLPDTIVGIMTERSVEMITGILGILKAGGAYLAIDPGNPRERIDYMLKDSNAKILLTGLPEGRDFHHSSFIIHHCNNLAYVIYTSGSTGRPKGVMVRHRGLVNMVWFHRRIFGENTSSRISQAASAAFDAMAFETWPALLSGACLCIIDNETRTAPGTMKQWLMKHQITISFQSTLMAQELLQEHWPQRDTSLRVLRTAGDTLKAYLTRTYPFRFYNLYGPTEDTIWTTWTEVPVNTDPDAGLPSIGKPTGNKRVYILGPGMELQPPGVRGELCITGDGLARGYLNNLELTYEKFKKAHELHEFTRIKKKRTGKEIFSVSAVSFVANNKIYKTGDLARWLPDGNIEFLGRIDHQVKIRGFRIEPGEIERVLEKNSPVKKAVVLDLEFKPGEKFLCAYYTADGEIDGTALTAALAADLPGYMIPSYFVRIPAIPLNPSGKVNRGALPPPDTVIVGSDKTAPRNEVEEKLVEIWSEILQLEKDSIGIHLNFFQAGGHSLKAGKLAAKIHERFTVKIPLVELFKKTTIAEISRYLSAGKQKPTGPETNDDNVVLLRQSRQTHRQLENLFLIHDGSGEVNGYIEFCSRLNPHFNYWGIKAAKIAGFTPINTTITEIARDYIEKMKKIQPRGPYHIAGWSLGGTIAFEIVRQIEQQGERIAFAALIDTPPPDPAAAKKVKSFTLKSEKTPAKHSLPPALLRLIPNHQQLSTGELTGYLNMIRTLARARSAYVPDDRIHTRIHYFAAADSQDIAKEDWKRYCRQPVTYHEPVPGDHYSIFALPHVRRLAEQFDNALAYAKN